MFRLYPFEYSESFFVCLGVSLYVGEKSKSFGRWKSLCIFGVIEFYTIRVLNTGLVY